MEKDFSVGEYLGMSSQEENYRELIISALDKLGNSRDRRTLRRKHEAEILSQEETSFRNTSQEEIMMQKY